MHKHFLIIVSQTIPRIVSVLDADRSIFEIKAKFVRYHNNLNIQCVLVSLVFVGIYT